MFHVGEMVVCVDDKPRRGHPWRPPGPHKGQVYTVREICTNPFTGMRGLLLDEIVRPMQTMPSGRYIEPRFLADRFRPVRKTDISVLRDAVAKVTNPALERANALGRNGAQRQKGRAEHCLEIQDHLPHRDANRDPAVPVATRQGDVGRNVLRVLSLHARSMDDGAQAWVPGENPA